MSDLGRVAKRPPRECIQAPFALQLAQTNAKETGVEISWKRLGHESYAHLRDLPSETICPQKLQLVIRHREIFLDVRVPDQHFQ